MGIKDSEPKKLNQDDVQVTDERIKKAASAVQQSGDIPGAYIPIRLSTEGRVGAPELFHIKNFATEELMELGLVEDEDLPDRVCKLLQKQVWEKDVQIVNFHEKEVIELLVRLYKEFYSTILKDLDWIPNDSDYEFMKKKLGEDTEEYRKMYFDIKNGKFKPKFDVDLNKIKYITLPEDLKLKAKITKSNGWYCVYSFARFGDVLILKKYVDEVFKEEDKKYASVTETLRMRDEAKERVMKGEEVDMRKIPYIPKAEMSKVREYSIDRVSFATLGAKALHLENFNGTDVSSWSLDKKMELAKDPQLDYNTLKAVVEKFNTVEMGIDENIIVRNPLQDLKIETRRFSFRINDIFSALQRGAADNTTIEFV